MSDVWLNGVFVSEDEARIDPRDGGFLHGAGVFTTTRARDGRIFRLAEHLKRLRDSCNALYVPFTIRDEGLVEAAEELLQRNGLADARLRITVTRGRTMVNATGEEVHQSTVLIAAGEQSAYPAEFYEKGMTALLNSEQKANPYDLQAGHKTLDYLSRFAALREAARRGAGESLWFNVHNFLQSGSISNVFIVEEFDGRQQVVTPPTNVDLRDEALKRICTYPKSNVLPGVVRGWVLEQPELNVQRLPIDVNRLLSATEVFITNSVMGIMPVTRLEQKVMGDGMPGAITRDVMSRFAATSW